MASRAAEATFCRTASACCSVKRASATPVKAAELWRSELPLVAQRNYESRINAMRACRCGRGSSPENRGHGSQRPTLGTADTRLLVGRGKTGSSSLHQHFDEKSCIPAAVQILRTPNCSSQRHAVRRLGRKECGKTRATHTTTDIAQNQHLLLL